MKISRSQFERNLKRLIEASSSIEIVEDEDIEDDEDKNSEYDWAEKSSLQYVDKIISIGSLQLPGQENFMIYSGGQIETAFMAGYRYCKKQTGEK